MRFGIVLFGVIASSAVVLADSEVNSIKIGATLALTGKLAFIGEAERDGLLLAIEEINKRGGVSGLRLELIAEDNAGEPKSAVSSVRKLLSVDQVDILFSAFTHITKSIVDIVARENKVMIYASSVKDMAAANPFVFRDYLDIEVDGYTVARLVHQNGHSRVFLIRDEGEVCESHQKAFEEKAKGLGLVVLGREEFISGETDLKVLLLRASRKKPQAFVFCAWRDAHTIMRQLNELGLLKIPTYHVLAPFLPVADSEEARRLYELNGSLSTWYGFAEGTSEKRQQEFVKKFVKRFGRKPRPDSAYAYDDVYLLAGALEKCVTHGRVDQICLRDELLAASSDGVSGRLSFDSKGNSNRHGLAIRVKKGKWVNIPLS